MLRWLVTTRPIEVCAGFNSSSSNFDYRDVFFSSNLFIISQFVDIYFNNTIINLTGDDGVLGLQRRVRHHGGLRQHRSGEWSPSEKTIGPKLRLPYSDRLYLVISFLASDLIR